MKAMTCLPQQADFFSKVSNRGVSDEDYIFAKNVFETFKCQNMLDYCELYCKADTLLLAECFLQFRDEVFSEMKLDCVHYISLPQLAYDSMLRMTKIEIECMTDIDMILFCEANIRGGVSFINTRHCLADPEPVLEEGEVESAYERVAMMYLDANNLCKFYKKMFHILYILNIILFISDGGAQSCPMPIGDYRWLTQDEIDAKDWTKFSDDTDTGYILSVDLDYPEPLHLAHNSLPLAPHRMVITENDLSPFAKKCLSELKGGAVKHKSEKLVSSFLPRREYVVHSANLSLYLSLGLKLRKIHKVLSYTQSTFLQTYISYCTSKRASSHSEFRKRLFKAFSNSNFGKFIEQTRSHLQCKIVSTQKDFERWCGNPRFSNFKILGSGFVAIFLKCSRVYMRQSWAIGFSILERSKYVIFDHYYNIIKPALGNKVSVMFTDTDSLCMRIKTKLTMQSVMKRLKKIMDHSNYPKDHPLYDPTRKNQLNFWKDELSGEILLEFCGLASKTYSMRVSCNTGVATKSKCKGLGRGFRTPFCEYKKCVIGISSHRTVAYSIQSRDHTIRTVKTNRLSFTSFDDKRWLLPCNLHTVPYGSKYIALCERAKRCLFCKK